MTQTKLLLLAGVCSSLISFAAAPEMPNIIMIMSDDQGWGDVAFNGHPELKTRTLIKWPPAGLSLTDSMPPHRSAIGNWKSSIGNA
jgi:hypothetical protein